MARIGVYILSCLLLCGLLRLGTGRPTGAPVEVCNRQNLMPLHLANVVNGAEIEAQRDTDLSTNQSPYVVILKDSPQDQKYDATTTLKVQVVRNPQYTETALVNFKGMILQMRAGDPALPVGKFELDQNLPENQVLGYDFRSNFQFLQCPRLNNFGNNIFDDNSVTHTNANDKVLANFAGPIFTWRPTTNDGLWNPNTGYGAIHAKASIVKDRQTFWVSLQTSFLEFRSPCGDNGNLMNGVCVCNGDFFGDTCQLTCGLFGNRINGVCVCNVNNDGWFGDLCQYNCNNGPGSTPPCQNFGTCNNDFQARNNGQYCTCQPTYTGPFCGTQLQTVCTTNNPCQNNGVCTDLSNGLYTCTCLSNYFGTNCEYHCQFSPPNCLNNGICNTNVQTQTNEPCACFSNFFGPFCQFSTACNPNPCLNSGACVEQAGGGYTCSCSSGYFGTNCQYHCQNSPPPCTNGFCNNDLTSQNIQPCICFANFGGLFCEQSLVCNPNPCLNGGACSINNGVNGGFTCACNSALGFFGDTCQYNCNQQMFPPCQNGGACNTNPNTQATQLCSCPSNAAGSLCASFIRCPDNINQPQSGNGQTAVQWAVPQMIGFANVQPFFSYSTIGGALSTTSTFDGRVQAFFSVGPTTVTVQGTDGVLDVSCTFVVTIDANPCSNFPCQNNGLCAPTGQSGFSCDCSNTGYIGLTCTSDDCYVPGACPNGQCSRCDDINQCVKDPVSGTFLLCSDACANNNPCNNNGMCFSNGNGGFTCQCFDGWTGQECIEPAGCNLTPCNSVGTQQCLPQGQTGYVCICTSDWAGTNCEYQNPCRVNLGPDGVENTCNPGICTLVQPFRPYPVSTVFADFTCECPGPDLGGQFCTIAICNPNCVNGQCEYNTLQSASFCQCFPGWTGIDCTTLDLCQSIICQNGGFCLNEDPTDVQCDCTNTGYTGSLCEIPLCTPACQNAGICQVFGTVGTCDCSGIPFDGPTCEIPVCSPFCQNGGTCSNINGQPICQCPQGFSGIDCSIPVCSPFCQNGGTCVNINGQPICQCLAGFTGIDCSTPVCSPFCQNGGTCVNINGQPICQCLAGFTGIDCSTPVCSPFCQNGGTCLNINGQPICQCRSGFTGNDCSTPVCSPFCQNGGTCLNINGQPICQCRSGFTGNDCSTPVCSLFCQNGGTCVNINGQSICQCLSGFTGNDCSTPVCSLFCQNGGTCLNINGQPICQCLSGFTGIVCSTPVCTPTCLNGQCVVSNFGTPICQCPSGYTGNDCGTLFCSPPCINGGVCGINGGTLPVCQCPLGYTGFDCGTPTGCTIDPCENGGICSFIGTTGYSCECTDPYFGPTCGQRDDCLVNTCQNGGLCTININGEFDTCVNCNLGYSGRYCEVYNPCTPGAHQCQNGICQVTTSNNYDCICFNQWFGPFCDQVPDGCNNLPCQNNGNCVPDGPSGFTCNCINGYFGTTCLYRDECIWGDVNGPIICLNGGTCRSDTNTGTTGTTGTGIFIQCDNCDTGYSGRYCQIDVCASHQCQNGNCVPTGIATYNCECNPNFGGQYCTEPLQCNPSPCQNGGVCVPMGTSYRCDCPPGYFGNTCQNPDSCLSNNPCLNGGECSSSPITGDFVSCVNCNAGYSGLYCNLYVCDYSFCSNGGTCIPISSSDYSCRCPFGWTGRFCSEPTACDSNPCQNEGFCTHTADGGYICQCTTSWTGPYCTIPRACQPGSANPCQNNGICTPTPGSTPDFRCQCTPLWTGIYCEEPIACQDPNICQNNGVCQYDSSGAFTRCRCPPGYFGTYCERDGCAQNPCGDHGYCDTIDSQEGFLCTCFDGYTGRTCDIAPVCGFGFANDPCQPNGLCQLDPTEPSGYVCLCYDEFSGDRCEIRDPCYNDPCLNGGDCRGDGLGSYTCHCYNGYTGLRCENRPVCSNNPCYNGGECYPAATGLQYRCECIIPYIGTRCEILSGCHDYPCGEHGECISDGSGSYRCDCIQGYTGRHCTIAPVCLNDPCHYGRCEATSNGNQVCICNPGYTGTYCERDACYDHSCYNGGTCEFNPNNGQTSCRCPTEFQGAYCEIPAFRLCDINICLNGGTCWDEPEQGSVCTCIPGYGGDLCGHRIISCAERICIYGDCIEADESRGKTSRCRCNTGWQGPQCDERIPTACSPNPCKNGGACQLFSLYSANFQCICRPGYTGDYCEKRNQIVKGSASKSIIVSLWTTVTALAFGIIFGRL